MTYFDSSLEGEVVTEQQSTPPLEEQRYVFELVGFERSEPDQYRKEGGVKWTFRVFHEDGQTPFVFDGEQYLFFRTTNIDKKTRKPLFTVGSAANDWAAALMGRTYGVDATVPVPELKGKRMAATVIWERQKQDKTKWTVKLATLRHVPVTGTPTTNGHAPVQVTADATLADVDRAELLTTVQKKVRQAEVLGTPKHLDWIGMDLTTMDVGELQAIRAAVQQDIDA